MNLDDHQKRYYRCYDVMTFTDDSLQKKIIYLEAENNRLRCCGNCDHYHCLDIDDSYCDFIGDQVNGYLICDKRQDDNLSQEERKKV